MTPSRYTGRVRVEAFVSSDWLLAPGETYRATCRTREGTVFVHEILVQDFTLVELYIGNHFVPTKERATVVGSRAYHLEPAGKSVPGHLDVSLVLKNDTDRSLRVREANFEEDR